MKANEAPEKLYVKITHPISDEYTEIIAFEDGDGIEYIRTDAFIERTCEWLKYNLVRFVSPNNMGTIYVSPSLFDKFKQEMEEQQ